MQQQLLINSQKFWKKYQYSRMLKELKDKLLYSHKESSLGFLGGNTFLLYGIPPEGVTRFASLYESFQPETSVQVSHFQYDFSGKQIDSEIWTQTGAGTPSVDMTDSEDGRLTLTTSASSGFDVRIHFNNIRHYSHNASVIIGVVKRDGATSYNHAGFQNLETTSDTDSAVYTDDTNDTYKSLKTGDASTFSTTASSVAINTNWTGVKIECGSADIKLYIDSVLEVTKTTNRPTAKMQPYFDCLSRFAGASTSKVRYCEAYNTSVSIKSSLHERLSSLTQVLRQRVREPFVGSNYDIDRWTLGGNTGKTASIEDGIDLGVKLSTSGTINHWVALTFNDIEPFDASDSVMIFTSKRDNANAKARHGFMHGGATAEDFTQHHAFVRNGEDANVTLETGNGTNSATASSIASNTDWHIYKIELSASDAKLYIDGVLEVTKTTNRPTTTQQPYLYHFASDSAVRSINYRYVEVYNKLVTETDYPSVNSLFNEDTDIPKTHFWDWLDGAALNTRIWNVRITGSSTIVIDDGIDLGALITTGASTNDRIELDFNNKRQFDYQNSIFIGVGKSNSTSDCAFRMGFTDDALSSFVHSAYIALDTSINSSFFILSTSGGSPTNTATSVALDTSFHVFKTVITSSNVKGYIDGVLEATNSTNLPTGKLQPHISGQTRTTAVKTFNPRYLEGKNT